MRSFATLLMTVNAGVIDHQIQKVECMDQLTQTLYQPGEEWTQSRVFEDGATRGMEGQFRCTCQDNGGITCRSLVGYYRKLRSAILKYVESL